MKSIAFASLINEKFLETCDFVSFCHPTFLSEFSYCGGRKLKKYYIVVSQDSPFFWVKLICQSLVTFFTVELAEDKVH